MPTKSSKGGCGEHPEFPRLAQFSVLGALTILLCIIETLHAKWAFYLMPEFGMLVHKVNYRQP